MNIGYKLRFFTGHAKPSGHESWRFPRVKLNQLITAGITRIPLCNPQHHFCNNLNQNILNILIGSGLKKYLNSALPVRQVTLKFCLPGHFPACPSFWTQEWKSPLAQVSWTQEWKSNYKWATYKLYKCSNNIPSSLSAHKPEKLVVHWFHILI